MIWMTLLIASMSWGGFDVCRKKLVAAHSPLLVSATFSLLSLPVYLILFCITEKNFKLTALELSYILSATASGVFAAVGAVSFILALSKGKLSVLIPLLALTPVVAVIVNAFVFYVHLPAMAYLLILVSCFATYRLLGNGFSVAEPGSGYMLLTAGSWGACICIDQYALQFQSAQLHAVWVNTVMICILWTCMLLRKERVIYRNSPWVWVVGCSLFCAAVVLQFIALKQLDASVVESIKRAVGVVLAVIIGRLFFQEEVVKRQLYYISMLVGSVMLLGTVLN